MWRSVLFSLLLLAACGESETVSEAPSEPRVGCNGRLFPESALATLPPLVADSDIPGLDGALNRFLSEAGGEPWPEDGWRVLHATESEVLIVYPSPEDLLPEERSIGFMTFDVNDGNPRWTGSLIGADCVLARERLTDASEVGWELADRNSLKADTLEIEVLATERACSGGRDLGPVLLPPEVVYRADAILIGLSAEPLSGAQACPGNPPLPVTVQLAEPLGERDVLDITATDLGDLRTVLLDLIESES